MYRALLSCVLGNNDLYMIMDEKYTKIIMYMPLNVLIGIFISCLLPDLELIIAHFC